MRKPFAPRVLLRRISQKAEIGGADLVVGIETEVTEAVDGPLADRLQVAFGRFAFDFDELAEVGDRIERDGVAVEDVAFAFFFDHGGGREPEGVEDIVEAIGVRDTGLHLFPGLRRLLYQRSLVGDAGRRLLAAILSSDAKRLVRLGEVAVRRVVVGVDLRDGPDVIGTKGVETLTDRVVTRPNLQFDFVHIRGVARGWQKRAEGET